MINMNSLYFGKQINNEIRRAVITALKTSGHYSSIVTTILTTDDLRRTKAHIKINNDYLHVVRRFKDANDFNISPTDLMKMKDIKLCLINSNKVFIVPVIDILIAVTNNELKLLRQTKNNGTFVHITSAWLISNNY